MRKWQEEIDNAKILGDIKSFKYIDLAQQILLSKDSDIERHKTIINELNDNLYAQALKRDEIVNFLRKLRDDVDEILTKFNAAKSI